MGLLEKKIKNGLRVDPDLRVSYVRLECSLLERASLLSIVNGIPWAGIEILLSGLNKNCWYGWLPLTFLASIGGSWPPDNTVLKEIY